MDPILALLETAIPATRPAAAQFHSTVHAAAKALFEKGDEATAAELASFDKLMNKADEIKAFIEKFPDPAKGADRLAAHDTFGSTARHPIGHAPATTQEVNPNHGYDPRDRFGVKGFEPAGYTEFNKRRELLAEIGPALYTAKKWDEMNDPVYAKAFYNEYIRKGDRMSPGAYKALEAGLDDSGGYAAPPEQLARMIQRIPSPTRLAGMVDTITTGQDGVVMPKMNYVASSTDDVNGYIFDTGFRATWTDELPVSDTQSEVSFNNFLGNTRVPIYTAMIEGPLSNNMVDDAIFDVQGFVESKFNNSIDQLYEQIITLGSGIQQGTGLVTTAVGLQPIGDPLPVYETPTSGVIVGNDIISCSEDLPEQYEGGATWIYSKTKTNKLLRLLVDDQKRYLFGQGYQDSGLVGRPPRELNGYPVTYSQWMPAATAGLIPIIFGDPKGYLRVVRLGFTIQVLREIIARRNQVLLLGKVRFGGQVIEPFRFRAFKVKA